MLCAFFKTFLFFALICAALSFPAGNNFRQAYGFRQQQGVNPSMFKGFSFNPFFNQNMRQAGAADPGFLFLVAYLPLTDSDKNEDDGSWTDPDEDDIVWPPGYPPYPIRPVQQGYKQA